MKKTDWKVIAEFIGISAIVVSLVFVAFQLRQEQAIARAAVWSETEVALRELAEFVNENRDIWIRGLDGEELSGVEELTFRAIAEAVYHRHLALYQRAVEVGTSQPSTRIQTYAYHLYQYPGLRRDFELGFDERERRVDAFGRPASPTGFRSTVKRALDEIDDRSPAIGPKSYLPF